MRQPVFMWMCTCALWANITPVIFLCNIVSAAFGKHWLDCGLWVNIVCIVQVLVLCNVGPSRPKQHCVDYFHAKLSLCAQVQYYKNSFLCNVVSDVFGQDGVYDILMQCCPSLIDTKSYRLFCYEKLSINHELTNYFRNRGIWQ